MDVAVHFVFLQISSQVLDIVFRTVNGIWELGT